MTAARLHQLVRERAPARALGLFRVMVGSAILAKGVVLAPILLRLADERRLRVPYIEALPAPSTGGVVALLAAWSMLAALLMVGFRVRAVGCLLTALMAYVLALDQQLYSNHLWLLLCFCALLCLADAGAAVSLDARGRGARDVALWPTLLIRAQISLVYLFAALAKLNPDYLSGEVLLQRLRWEDAWAPLLALRLGPGLAALVMTSVLLEAFLAVGLWCRPARPAAFVGGLALHGTIVLTMHPFAELTIFAVASLGAYLLFVDAEPGRLAVQWDERCAFCSAWARQLHRLDWLHTLALVGTPAGSWGRGTREIGCEGPLRLVGPDAPAIGFDAVVAAAERLPISMLWAPLLRLPPVRAVGQRLFRWSATRRGCQAVGVLGTFGETLPGPEPSHRASGHSA